MLLPRQGCYTDVGVPACVHVGGHGYSILPLFIDAGVIFINYPRTGPVHKPSLVILIPAPLIRFYYQPHFIDEVTQRFKSLTNLPKVTYLINVYRRAGAQAQYHCQMHRSCSVQLLHQATSPWDQTVINLSRDWSWGI